MHVPLDTFESIDMRQHKKTPYLQQIFESIWYRRGWINTTGKYLLLPFSALFCLLANYKKKRDTAAQVPLSIPVIVVGNISIGGTGKTPLVIKLTQLLKQAGYHPAIITRGYKGTATHWPLLVDADISAQQAGDEAKLMAIRTQVPVIAGADRVADIRYAIEHTHCDIILSDDGLQHYKMKRDMEIAVIDAERQLGNGFCLPSGPLREREKRLNSCDFVISNEINSLNLKTASKSQHHPIRMQLTGSYCINPGNNKHKAISEFKSVHVVTGIGNPQRFINTLTNKGVTITTLTVFPDHHPFVATDFDPDSIVPIIMTEKDAVKCLTMELDNCWYFPVDAELDDSFEKQFIDKVARLFDA